MCVCVCVALRADGWMKDGERFTICHEGECLVLLHKPSWRGERDGWGLYGNKNLHQHKTKEKSKETYKTYKSGRVSQEKKNFFSPRKRKRNFFELNETSFFSHLIPFGKKKKDFGNEMSDIGAECWSITSATFQRDKWWIGNGQSVKEKQWRIA